jgi:hypothetical protein
MRLPVPEPLNSALAFDEAGRKDHMNRHRCFLVGLILMLLIAAPAAAALTVYTDRNAWLASLAGNVVTDDFAGDPAGERNTPFTTSTGVMLTALGGGPITIQILDEGLVNGSRELHFRDFAAGVGVTLPNNGHGFGFDYATAIEPWTIQVGDRATVLPANTSGFVGYVDDAGVPISSFTLRGAFGAQGGISLDNLSRTNQLLDAGELHNEGVRFVLEHLSSLPRPEEVKGAILELTHEYCASIGQDCSWLRAPARLPRDPQPLIDRLQGSRALRRRAEAVFAVVEIRAQRPRNARSLRQFHRTLDTLETSYQRPLNATDSARLSNLVSVAHGSGSLWASRAEDGMQGVDYLDLGPDRPGFRAIDWGQVVIADLEGCIAGMEAVPFPPLELDACIAGAILYSTIEVVQQTNF